jgi:hypothetical protein
MLPSQAVGSGVELPPVKLHDELVLYKWSTRILRELTLQSAGSPAVLSNEND